jgi:hypothetical protein
METLDTRELVVQTLHVIHELRDEDGDEIVIEGTVVSPLFLDVLRVEDSPEWQGPPKAPQSAAAAALWVKLAEGLVPWSGVSRRDLLAPGLVAAARCVPGGNLMANSEGDMAGRLSHRRRYDWLHLVEVEQPVSALQGAAAPGRQGRPHGGCPPS